MHIKRTCDLDPKTGALDLNFGQICLVQNIREIADKIFVDIDFFRTHALFPSFPRYRTLRFRLIGLLFRILTRMQCVECQQIALGAKAADDASRNRCDERSAPERFACMDV